MITRSVVISNKSGLHARPASEFVSLAKEYKSRVWIKVLPDSMEEIDAKSILQILTSGLVAGTCISISAEGPDEIDAVNSLVELVANRFGET